MSGDESGDPPPEDVEEVTRCICGNIEPQIDEDVEDTGLFVQCDNCLVWQHGYCVGLLHDSQMPETYHCEICRPDLHQIILRPRKPKVSKYLGVDNASSPPGTHHEETEEVESGPRRKRSTMNSRDAAYDRQLEAALLLSARDGGGQPEIPAPSVSGRSSRSVRRQSPALSKRGRTPSPSPPREEPKQKRRKKGGPIKKEEIVKEEPSTAPKRRGGKRKGGTVSAASTPVIDNYEEPSIDASSDLPRPKSSNTTTQMPAPALPSPPHVPSIAAASREGTPSTQTTAAPVKKRGGRNTKKTNGSAAGPPVSRSNTTTITTAFLPNTPSGKFHSLADMRKRVSAILEYVGRAQEEMAAEVVEWAAFAEEANNYQLVDNKKRREDTVWGYGYSEGGSVELMEELTGSLLRWESLYG